MVEALALPRVIGGNIRKIRQEARLTQRQLAEKLGCSQQSVAAWEIGISRPDLNYLLKMGSLFDVSVDSLVY